MKKKYVIDLYRAYTSVKFTGVPTADRLAMLRNMRIIKPISDEYDALQMDASERFKPDGYDELEQEVMSLAGETATAEVSKKLAKYNIQKTEYMKAMNDYLLGVYDKQTGKRTGGLLDEEHDLKMEPISAEAFDKLVQANEQADTKHLCVISEYAK